MEMTNYGVSMRPYHTLLQSVTVCCLKIRANREEGIILAARRQCFHGRADDERDTWCHDVGAKCHCHFQAHLMWQMAICSLRSENLVLWNKQFPMCCVIWSSNVIYCTSVCVWCVVEASLRGWTDSSADRGQLLASGGTSPSLRPQQQVIHTNTPSSPSWITILTMNFDLWVGWSPWFPSVWRKATLRMCWL